MFNSVSSSKVRPFGVRKGYTMLELGFAFIIIGVLLGVIIGTFYTIQLRQTENNTKALVQTLVSGTKSLYSGSIDYDAIGTSRNDLPRFLTDGKKVPSNYLSSNFASGIVSPFNTEIRMQAHSNNTFSVQLRSTPTDICNALLSEYAVTRSALSATFGGNLSATAPTRTLDVDATSGGAQWTVANVADQCNNSATQHVALTFQ